MRLRHAGYVRLIVSEDGAAVFYATKNLASRHMESRGDASDGSDDANEDEDEDEDEDDEALAAAASPTRQPTSCPV